ncbi:hypothetical protein E2C01_048443 [Portunus trituberculatus]|uniref:Uncharacterized protein n=1 Tax=Portunus trituberculatus TaxID=210409 RepID=A0A5B7GB59_PORTR|nr:hypothetical protein [Portunus trituberculatus]
MELSTIGCSLGTAVVEVVVMRGRGVVVVVVLSVMVGLVMIHIHLLRVLSSNTRERSSRHHTLDLGLTDVTAILFIAAQDSVASHRMRLVGYHMQATVGRPKAIFPSRQTIIFCQIRRNRVLRSV